MREDKFQMDVALDLSDPNMGFEVFRMDNCDMGLRVIRHPLYRFAQMCGVLTSALAVLFLCKLFHNNFFRMSFHFNIKFILTIYYVNAFAQALLYTITQSKQFFLGFVLSQPCDVFLNRSEYIICHLTNLFLIQNQLWLLVAMWVERLFATILSNKYEHRTKFLGPLFAFLASLPVAGGLLWVYWDEDFAEPATDHINTPLTSAARVNDILVGELAICLLGCVFVLFLRRYNNRQLMKARYDLTTQYQLTENITATRFILRLSIFTILCYVALFSGTLAVRLLKDSVFFKERFPLFQGLRNVTYVLPLFTLFLPLISEVIRNDDRKREQHKRESIVEQSNVRDPGSIYSRQLERQWKVEAPPPVIKFPRSFSLT